MSSTSRINDGQSFQPSGRKVQIGVDAIKVPQGVGLGRMVRIGVDAIIGVNGQSFLSNALVENICDLGISTLNHIGGSQLSTLW